MKNYYKTFTKAFWSITEATIDCKVTDELLQKQQQNKQNEKSLKNQPFYRINTQELITARKISHKTQWQRP